MNSKDPLHGITLEALLTELVAHHGWDGLARQVDVRCFKLVAWTSPRWETLRGFPPYADLKAK